MAGTKAGSVCSSRATSISCLSDLISQEQDTIVLDMEGVGSASRSLEGAWQGTMATSYCDMDVLTRYSPAITGSGAKKIVFRALSKLLLLQFYPTVTKKYQGYLAMNYRDGDSIVLLGFSRGKN